MSEALKNIDRGLIDLEDRLLMELQRLRKLDTDEVYSHIDPPLHEEMKKTYTALLESLQATGDWSNLSLKSQEQEWIEDRMRIVRNLLVRKLPTAFLTTSHNEHKATSKSEFGTDAHYASELLVILDEQVAMHQVDGRTIEEIVKERAEFNSRELSKGHAQELAPSRRNIAQSPDEIRKKLAGSRGTGGPSSFTSKDLGGSNPNATLKKRPSPAEANREIAQSPEAIRRKLAERQTSNTGKASFGSKDIEGISDRMPAPRPQAQPTARPPAPQPTGKAVFGSKDIEPVAEKFNKKKEEPPKPKAGPAIFESRDLSGPKP